MKYIESCWTNWDKRKIYYFRLNSIGVYVNFPCRISNQNIIIIIELKSKNFKLSIIVDGIIFKKQTLDSAIHIHTL